MKTLPKLAFATLSIAALAAAALPWRIDRTGVARALGGNLPVSTGLATRIAGDVTFKLLPRPRIQAKQLSMSAEGGAVLVDAPLLKAEIDIPSLIRGAWRISTATLVEPTVTLDLDRLGVREDRGSPRGDALGMTLHLRDGVLRTRSATASVDMLATGINASAEWSGDGDALAVSGSATVRGNTAQFAGTLDHPDAVMSTEGSALSLQIDSPLCSLTVAGIVSRGTQQQFVGHAALATPSLARLFRAFDGQPVSFDVRRTQISGDLVAKPHELALSNASVKFDRSRFEGTLAWRRDGDRSLIAGTLATESLDVDALLGAGLDQATIASVAGRRLDPSTFGIDLDLRASAAAARIGRVRLTDAAGAILIRGGRLELTLDEAGAYDGIVKARAIATLGPDGMDAHADLSARNVDLAGVSAAMGGAERVGGSLGGHAALDGRGASLRDVLNGLSGKGQIGVDHGILAGLSLAQALRRLGRKLPVDIDRRGPSTTFDKALWDVTVERGLVKIPDGRLTTPGVAMSFGAATALPDGTIAVHAMATQSGVDGSPLHDGGRLSLDLRGTWSAPLFSIGRGLGVPVLPLPSIGAASSLLP